MNSLALRVAVGLALFVALAAVVLDLSSSRATETTPPTGREREIAPRDAPSAGELIEPRSTSRTSESAIVDPAGRRVAALRSPRVFGRVLDPDGAPVASARVLLVQHDVPRDIAISRADGTFEWISLPRARDDAAFDVADVDLVSVAGAQDPLSSTFAEPERVASTEKPPVRIRPDAGPCTVVAVLEGWAPSLEVDVSPTGDTAVELRLTALASIHGTLFTVDGNPVARASIDAAISNTKQRAFEVFMQRIEKGIFHGDRHPRLGIEITTGPDGRFEVSGLWPQLLYDLRQSVGEHRERVTIAHDVRPGPDDVAIHAPCAVGIDVGALRGPLTVTVFRRTFARSYSSARQLELRDQRTPLVFESAVLGFDYVLEVDAERQFHGCEGPVRFDGGERTLRIDTSTTGSIEVDVIGVDGRPAPYAEVSAVPDARIPSLGVSARTGTDGHVLLDHMQPRSWILSADCDHRSSADASVGVTADEVAHVRLSIADEFRARGRH